MGSVIEQSFASCMQRRYHTGRIKIGLAIFYLLAIPLFIIIGLHSVDTSAEVRASEVAQADEYLVINSIGLETPVVQVKMHGRTLNAPQYLAGAYHGNVNKTLIIGHSSTIFEHLREIKLGDYIDYEDGTYRVTNLETLAKEDISMAEILTGERVPTVVLMTCAGEPLGGMDFTHRLIVTAEKV